MVADNQVRERKSRCGPLNVRYRPPNDMARPLLAATAAGGTMRGPASGQPPWRVFDIAGRKGPRRANAAVRPSYEGPGPGSCHQGNGLMPGSLEAALPATRADAEPGAGLHHRPNDRKTRGSETDARGGLPIPGPMCRCWRSDRAWCAPTAESVPTLGRTGGINRRGKADRRAMSRADIEGRSRR